ncbi:MAG: hypothetical protein J6U52_01040, partial [Alistipes sp.]|nr:hypothetical protein [Alistipes sp.]
PFQLFAETGELLASGYVKLDKISVRRKRDITYHVSLYGGLGSFFYDLSYDDNGDEMSLADIVYHDKTDTEIDLEATTLDITAANIYDLWQELLGSTSTFDWANILTFAPCNNGYPKDFDAKKAIIGYTQFYNIPYVSGDFSWNSAAQGILVNMENNHDEWEMRDLRAYLQRPVLSVKEILLAIQRTTTYDLIYNDEWFDDTNPRYAEAWLTLPVYKAEDGDYTGISLRDLIKGTMTPAAFLISYARTFGLVFKVEGERITVMKRSTYYAEQQYGILDLTGRIDTESIEQRPFAFDAKWYTFSNSVEGAFAAYYKDKYGRDYGEQRVNTGYEFDNSVKPLMDGLKFKGAVQALESSPLFRLIGKSGLQNFAPAYSEKITIRLYDNANNQSSDVEPLDTTYDSPEVEYNNDTYPFADFQDRPQFHDGEGKALDGSGVLLFFAGVTPLPTQTTFLSGFNYHLSDDDPTALDLLNDGKPCWDIRGGFAHIQALTDIPHFSRWLNELSLDFGVPSEIAVVGDTVLHNGIYTQR